MPFRRVLSCVLSGWILCLVWAVGNGQAQPPAAASASLALWPDSPPGKITAQGPERDTTGENGRNVAGRSVIRLGHVSSPELTVYSPPPESNTGAAVIVCPGGGYHILAYDLEGTEVCEWLNSIGVTGVLLKYRVPRPEGTEGVPEGPLMDAQRAVSLVRSRAAEWSIDPEKIGILGFSAGGNLAARAATNFDKRAYAPLDDVDQVSCRPDFAVLIYPAYLFTAGDELIAKNLPVSEETPPMFLTMAFDDGVGPENILRMGIALKRAEVSCEVHLYPSGGHGYGLRANEHQATTWPARCASWMDSMGWLAK